MISDRSVFKYVSWHGPAQAAQLSVGRVFCLPCVICFHYCCWIVQVANRWLLWSGWVEVGGGGWGGCGSGVMDGCPLTLSSYRLHLKTPFPSPATSLLSAEPGGSDSQPAECWAWRQWLPACWVLSLAAVTGGSDSLLSAEPGGSDSQPAECWAWRQWLPACWVLSLAAVTPSRLTTPVYVPHLVTHRGNAFYLYRPRRLLPRSCIVQLYTWSPLSELNWSRLC